MPNLTVKANSEGASDSAKFFDRACDIIVAFLNNNAVKPSEITEVMRNVRNTLAELFESSVPVSSPILEEGQLSREGQKPAVAVAASVTPEYIVCLEDGKQLRTLKRYLKGRYGLSPEQYRAKWKLPSDYPMVAPNYSMKRSQLAKKIGLGNGRRKKRRSSRR